MLTLKTLSLRPVLLGSGLLLSLAASGCCMGGSSSPSVPPLPTPVATAPVAPVAPAVVAGTQAVTIGAGFLPDPTVAITTAGGSIPASTYSTADQYCAGNVGALPNVTLTTTTPIVGLRIMARSPEDTTLVVRLSDGRVLCSDDGGGYPNPLVEGDFPAGVHQIYVGAFHVGETPAATIGITTNPMLQPLALP